VTISIFMFLCNRYHYPSTVFFHLKNQNLCLLINNSILFLPQPVGTTILLSISINLTTLAPRISGITIFVLLWLGSSMFSMCQTFLPFQDWIKFHYMHCYILCVHSSSSGHWWYTHILATVINVTTNTSIEQSLWALLSVIWGIYPEVRLMDHMGVLLLIFLIILYCFRSDCTILRSHQQCIRVPVSPHHHLHSIFSGFVFVMMASFLMFFFYFIIFTFAHMCIHCLGHLLLIVPSPTMMAILMNITVITNFNLQTAFL
jgi:hypothetical protein